MEAVEYRASRKRVWCGGEVPAVMCPSDLTAWRSLVSVVGAVSLECKDGSLCVVSGKGNRRQRLQLVTRNSPKGMSKIG